MRIHYLFILIFFYPWHMLMAQPDLQIIDDRSSGDLTTLSGNHWSLVTDNVMGGVSQGSLTVTSIEDRECLRMQGEVKLENNGGFVQMSLDISDAVLHNITDYSGIMLQVYGNEQQYNIHLRTSDVSLPWQSYRSTLYAPSEWQTIHLPFSEFRPYRIDYPMDIAKLRRVGIVAIGRAFEADLCIGKLALYR